MQPVVRFPLTTGLVYSDNDLRRYCLPEQHLLAPDVPGPRQLRHEALGLILPLYLPYSTLSSRDAGPGILMTQANLNVANPK